MKFQELTDRQWDTIAKHLPEPASTGRPRCDDRITINGIMFVLVTGRSFQRGIVQNQLHTYDSKICNKREYGERSLPVQSNQHTRKTGIEKICDSYLGFVCLACVMMYWRVLG